MNKKLSLIFLFALIISSCASERTVDVAMVVSLSGNYSPLLTTSRNGAMLAVEEINSLDGRLKLNLVVADDESDNQLIVDKTVNLLNEGFELFIFSVTSGAYSQVEQLINEHNVLAISPTVSSDEFKDKDDNLIRMSPDASVYAEALASHALARNKKRTVIVYDTNNLSYAENMIGPFRKGMKSGNNKSEIFELKYNSLEPPSFMELGEQVEAFQPDSVLIIASPFDTALICQHLQHFQGDDYLKLIATWAFSDELIENGGRAVEGVIVYIKEETESEEGAYQKFEASYESRFGDKPTFQSLAIYDTVNYLYDILESETKYDPATVRQAILDSGGFQGLNLLYEINKYGDCSFQLQAYTVKNGKFVRLQPGR